MPVVRKRDCDIGAPLPPLYTAGEFTVGDVESSRECNGLDARKESVCVYFRALSLESCDQAVGDFLIAKKVRSSSVRYRMKTGL
jgi:hypothetical protein